MAVSSARIELGPRPCKEENGVFYEEVDGVWYPFSEEDEPVVQSDWRDITVRELANMLQSYLARHPGAYLGSDMLVFWEKGNRRKCEGPDIFICPLVESRDYERKSFYVWEELSGPRFVLEVLSGKTAKADRGRKRIVYRDELRVPEYFLVDPRWLPHQVGGFRLVSGRYDEIAPDARGRIWSAELRLWFGPDEGGFVRIWDEEGEPFLRHYEALARAEAEAHRATEEQRRAEAEAHRAAEERRRAAAAEARVRELEEEVARLRQAPAPGPSSREPTS